jgi:hypothetical protein
LIPFSVISGDPHFFGNSCLINDEKHEFSEKPELDLDLQSSRIEIAYRNNDLKYTVMYSRK